MKDIAVFGRKPVLEALRAQMQLEEILLAAPSEEIEKEARRRGIRTKRVHRDELDRLLPGVNHQSVAAVGTAIPLPVDIADILAEANRRSEKPLVAVLDGITDPQNLGAIIRSAECAGFHGILIPKHGSAGVNSVVMKTSAGAASYMKIATVTNLVQALEKLKEAGLWIYGTDDQGDKLHTDIDGCDPLALVIGSEGKGMRKMVAEHCDFQVRIPVYGNIGSLNASVAAGILFYEIVRKRKLA